MKKITSSLLAIFLVFCVSASALANNDDLTSEVYTDEITGEEILAVYEVDENGNFIEVSFEEYEAEMDKTANSTKKNDNPTSPKPDFTLFPYDFYGYEFLYESFSQYYEGPRMVAQGISCNGAQPCPISATQQTTVTETFTANLGIDSTQKKAALKAGAGYSISTAKSNQTSQTLYIPVGERAYLGFKPKLNKWVGDLNYFHQQGVSRTIVSTETATVTAPLIDGTGNAAGYFLLVRY
ncbi:hypothetical protein ACFQ3J_08690 [Paenibacillus provencensis]|uniref:Uncharacterized protein n=1 Tax=Paenibacillus provencensis TaxID=441151 RepID=A0ABW3PRS5_9BACL|nr:hypothetical protein [Paenibacillus sp. MER 78]MCM3129034.1 hypothetical protein [Paenibacillus sp. MER 78]